MIELGKIQTLVVVRTTDFGFYLAKNPTDKHSILLPKKYIPPKATIGTEIEVFVYKDSEDRLIATTKFPALELGQLALLKVIEVGSIGAFLDWGLEKDLLLPFKEQTERVKSNSYYLVSLYIDKSERLCATMKIHNLLSTTTKYNPNDKVIGTVYDIKEEFGIFIAIDNAYYGLINKNEIYSKYHVGDSVEARVTSIREDGKLNLSTREKIPVQIDSDSELIYLKLEQGGGSLPFSDSSNPELIKSEFGLSKNAFKRAIGKLLKEGKISINHDSIEKR